MPVTNLNQFIIGLDRFKKVPEERTVKFLQDTSRLAMRTVVGYTPFYSGRLMGSWRMAVNGIDSDVSPEGRRSVSAARAESLSKMFVLNGVRFGDRVVISNSLDYAVYVENGSPSRAPRLMVQRTLAVLTSRARTIK